MIYDIRLVILLLFVSIFSYGQIRLSECIKKSKLVEGDNASLYFVDFWATWCGPCLSASKYLNVLQGQFPQDLHIVSISQENESIVKVFLKRHKLQLTSVLDYQGNTFDKFNIRSLPYGILFNANGAKVWEGHPADIKTKDIKAYLLKYKARARFNEFFDIVENEAQKNEDYVPVRDFEFQEISTDVNGGVFTETINNGLVKIEGLLREVLAYGWRVNVEQVELIGIDNSFYRFYFKENSQSHRNVPETIIRQLGLESSVKVGYGETYILDMSLSKLWDKYQIAWDENQERYLIGDSEIKADNISIKNMGYILGKALGRPVIIKNSPNKNSLHDWEIHYKYHDLMVSSLYDNYKIDLLKQNSEFPKYSVSKKSEE